MDMQTPLCRKTEDPTYGRNVKRGALITANRSVADRVLEISVKIRQKT